MIIVKGENVSPRELLKVNTKLLELSDGWDKNEGSYIMITFLKSEALVVFFPKKKKFSNLS